MGVRCAGSQTLEGVDAELVGYSLFDAVTLDDFPRLHIVRQDDPLLPDGATGFLDRAQAPHPLRLARPEREACSVRAVEDVPARDPGRDLDLLSSPRAERPGHLGPPLVDHVRPKSRWSLPRSKPTTASPSMTVIGVDR